MSTEFGPYTIDFMIFTERTRFSVDKVVKEYKETMETPDKKNMDQDKKSERAEELSNKPRSFVGS